MKRVLRFLGLAALCGLGLNALAAGNVAKVGDTEYATIEEAHANVPDGGTIELIANAVLTQEIDNKTASGVSMHACKFTVDLKGYTLTMNSGIYTFYDITFKNGTIKISDPSGAEMGTPWTKVFYVEGNAKIAPVTLTFDHVKFVCEQATVTALIETSGTNAVNKPTVRFNECELDLASCGKPVNLGGSWPTVEFINSTIVAKDVSASGLVFGDNPHGLAKFSGGEVHMTDYGRLAANCQLEIENCVVTATGLKKELINNCAVTLKNGAKVDISASPSVKKAIDVSGLVAEAGCELKIAGVSTDGVFLNKASSVAVGAEVSIDCPITASAALQIAAGAYSSVAASGASAAIDLTGGIYKVKPDDAFVNPSCKALKNTDDDTKNDYPWMVAPPPPVAKIGEKTYTSLQEAVDEAVAGAVVEFLDNIELTAVLPIRKAITLDFKGKTLTLGEGSGVDARTGVENDLIFKNGNLKIKSNAGANLSGDTGTAWHDAFFVANTKTWRFESILLENEAGYPSAPVTQYLTNRTVFNIGGGGEVLFDNCNLNFKDCTRPFYLYGPVTFVDTQVTAEDIRDGHYVLCQDLGYLTKFTNSQLLVKNATGVGNNFNMYLDESTIAVTNATGSCFNTSKNDGLVLVNGSSVIVSGATYHGITNAKVEVNDDCSIEIREAKRLGICLNQDSKFAAGSKVSVIDCATDPATVSTYDKLGLVVINDAKLTIEKDADVWVSNTISSGWMTATNCGYLDIADGRYGAVAKSASNQGDFIDLTGGIYKEEPDAAFVNKKARVVHNDDEATKDEYPYMVYRLPDVAQVGEETYVSLQEAYNETVEGDTIKILADFDLTEKFEIGTLGRNNLVIDLNGKTMTLNTVVGTWQNLTFANGSIVVGEHAGGRTGEHAWNKLFYVEHNNYTLRELKFDNVVFTYTNDVSDVGFAASYTTQTTFKDSTLVFANCKKPITPTTNASIVFDNTVIKAENAGDYYLIHGEDANCGPIVFKGGSSVTIKDGVGLNSNSIVEMSDTTLTASGLTSPFFNGCSVTFKNVANVTVTDSPNLQYAIENAGLVAEAGCKLRVSGVSTDGLLLTQSSIVKLGADVSIDCPIVTSSMLQIAAGSYESVNVSGSGSISLTGGIYDVEPEDGFVAKSYKKTELKEYDPVKWLVELDSDDCPAVIYDAAGNPTYYATFAEAVDAAKSGGTISVNREIEEAEPIEIANKSVTLDLAGQLVNAGISFTGTQETDFIIDSVGGGKVLGEISVAEGCTLKIRAGTYAFDPSEEPTKWLDPEADQATGRALYVVIKDGELYKVMPNQIEVKVPDPKEVVATDENGDPIPASEQAEAAEAINKANDEVKQTIEQNSSIDTGIETAAKEPVKTPSGEIVPGPAKSGVVKALQAEAPEAAKGQITAQSDISSRLVIDIKSEISTVRTVVTDEGPKKDAIFTTILYKVEPIVKTVVTVTDGAGEETTEEVEATLPNEELKKNPLTFRLGIKDPQATGAYVRHIGHDEFEDETVFCKVQGPADGRYVELTVDHFSDFEVRTVDAVVVDTDDAVGIVKLGVPGAGMELAAAVPFLKSGVENGSKATLADLVVTGRENGDTIVFQKTGDESALSGDVWGGDTAQTPGTAFWYKSTGSSIPLTLAGLVTDPVETAVTAGTEAAPVATLLVNPYVAAQDVFAAVGDAARDGDQVALVGGDVRYVREDGAWGYWKKSEYRANPEVADGGLFMSNEFVRVSSLSVPGGKGVWYVSKGGSPTVAWTAGVPAVTAEQIADAALPTWGSLAWDVSLTAADMDAFAPEKVNLVAYDADGAKVGDYARPLVVDELGQHWTTFLGLDGYDWTDKDVTAAQFAVELLDADENVLASTEKVGYGDLLAEKALDVTYAGDKTPAVATDLHAFAGFSVSDNGEFASLTNAFAGFGYVTKTAGGLTVTLTNDMEGVVTIADTLGSVTLDQTGFSIPGTNGVNGAGGVALAVTDHIVPGGAATQLLVKDRTGNGGKIVGGKGDRGAAGYAGGAAIVIADGVTVELATGDKLPLVKGGNGGTGYVTAGGAAGYAVAKASGEKVTVDGTDDTALPGEFWEAWAWCVCDAPAAEIPGTYHDGTTLWIHRRDGNMRTGAAEFDFAELKDLNVAGGAIHFLPGDFGVKCLTVGTDASDSLAFLGADTGTTLYESSHFSVFDVKRGEGQSACWTNITFTSVGIDDLYGLGGGAIRQEGGSLVVSQCVFSNLVANVGGAIYAEFLAKDSLIADSVFADNEAINYGSEGGAVFAAAKAGTDVTLALEKCSFTGNRAGNGGAVSVASDFEGDGPITLAVADSRFEGNAADFAGGAIFGNPKALLVDAAATKDDPGETAFLGNSAELSGGAICLNGDLYGDRPAVTMRRGVRFVGNIASNALDFADGGAFACGLRGGCEFAAEGVEFTGNLAFGKYEAFGGALSFYTNCAVTVDTCVFDDNDADCPLETLYLNYGGAIESEHGAASIRNSTFRNSNVEAVALICGTAAITNCVAVGNGETVGDYKYDDLYFDACAADVSYSAWGTVFFYEGDSVTGVFNLTNRTTEIYAGDDTLRLNPVGLNPVAALGVKQEAYDFVGVKYGSKAYGSSMGAYETPTERLYVNLNGDKTYDGTTASNDVTWTWTYTTESGAPAAWDDFVTADKFDTVFTLTNWVYGCKDHGYYATTNAAPRDLDAQIKGNDDLAQWYLDSGILEFVGTGAIARRPVEMGGLEFTIDPDEYEWNDGNPVDATVTVVEKIGNLAPLTLVEGTDYHLTCSENTDYTKKAVATADLLHNWIGSTNDTYYITAYLVEYLYDDVVDASLTETYGKTSGVAVAVSGIANPRTGYAFDLYNSPTNGTVRKFDEGDGILRLKVCYYTDVAPADGIPDIYQRKVLAKVVNGSWNTGYKDDATLYATLWDDAGKWSRTGSGAISSGTIPVGGNNAFGQFSAGGWLALTSGGLVEVSNPATFEFDSSTVPFLIYAYRHGTEAGGSGRGGSGRGGSSGRPGSGTAPAQTSLLEQYSAVLSIRDVSFAVDGVTLQTKAVVSGNGADIDVPMEGTTLKVFATESLGKPWNEVKATADGEGRVTIPGNGAASCFFKVGL